MSYALVNTAAVTSGFNVTLAPAMPAGFAAGNLLLLQTQCYQGSLATPTVSGWTLLSPGVKAKQIALFGKIAVGADASPSITWGNQFASAWVTAYSGNQASLSGIVHASIDYLATNVSAVTYLALPITQPNCLVIAGASRDKTANTDTGVWDAITNFSIRQSSILAGASIAAVMNDWIQTTATTAPQVIQYMTKSDLTAQQYESYVVALLPNVVTGPIYPVPSGARQTFVNDIILQY